MIRKLFSFLIALLASLFSFGSVSDEPQETGMVEMQLAQNAQMTQLGLPDFVIPTEELELTAYSRLSEAEKELYDLLLWGIANQKDRIYLEAGITEEMMDKCYACIDMDHPELFWMSTACVFWEDTVTGDITSVEPEYYFDEEEVAAYQPQILAAKGEKLQGISADASDYEKVKYVYETVILDTTYVDESEHNQSLYSTMINNETVCTGYAKAVQYLLQELQIPCIYVSGMAEDNEGADLHAWNIVEIEDQFYYVDATWGDSDDPADEDYIDYNYLCRDQTYMGASHRLEAPVEMPECLDDSLNYYKLNDMWYESYNEEFMKEKIASDLERNVPMILAFAKEEDYKAMFEDLENGNVNDWICETKNVGESSIEYLYDDVSFYIELLWVED